MQKREPAIKSLGASNLWSYEGVDEHNIWVVWCRRMNDGFEGAWVKIERRKLEGSAVMERVEILYDE